MLDALKMAYLHHNLLTGTMPSAVGNCSKLEMLSLHTNTLSGSLPPSLGQLQNLQYLWLGYNSLRGSIPDSLGQMTSLVEIYLLGNRLSGSIPSTIGRLRKLQKLLVDNNRLSGPIPISISNLTNLTVFTASNNALSGTIPAALPPSLQDVVLHRNMLTGSLPSFRNFPSLRTLTLFQQQLYGRLVLPYHAPSLSVVMVHSNRLSCRVEANHELANSTNSPFGYNSTLSHAQNLLGPGNSFSEPAMPWAATSSVDFLWSEESILTEWATNFGYMCAGLPEDPPRSGRRAAAKPSLLVSMAASSRSAALSLPCLQHLLDGEPSRLCKNRSSRRGVSVAQA